jgi:hypothetical protein
MPRELLSMILIDAGGAMGYVRHGMAAESTVHILNVLDLKEGGGRIYFDSPEKRY